MRRLTVVVLVVAAVAVLWWLIRRAMASKAPASLAGVDVSGKVKPDGTTATTRPAQESAPASSAVALDAPSFTPGTLTGLPEYQEPIRSDFTPPELLETAREEVRSLTDESPPLY
jgi:hypothetical protein